MPFMNQKWLTLVFGSIALLSALSVLLLPNPRTSARRAPSISAAQIGGKASAA